MSAQVHAIAGGKGGVGKTTTTLNVSAALSAAGYDVVAVDVDLAMANLGQMLGIEVEDAPTVHDVLGSDTTVADAIHETEYGFDVVAGTQTLEGYANADPSRLRADLVKPLRDAYDVVLLDTSAGLSHEVTVPLGLADSVLLVTTADVVAIKDAAKTGKLTGRVGGTVEGVVLTRARDDEATQQIIDELGDQVLAVVPEDGNISMNAPIATTGSPTSEAYSELAARLLGQESLDETDGEYAGTAGGAGTDPETAGTDIEDAETAGTATEDAGTDAESAGTATEDAGTDAEAASTDDGVGETPTPKQPPRARDLTPAIVPIGEDSDEDEDEPEDDGPDPTSSVDEDRDAEADDAFSSDPTDDADAVEDAEEKEERAGALGRLRDILG